MITRPSLHALAYLTALCAPVSTQVQSQEPRPTDNSTVQKDAPPARVSQLLTAHDRQLTRLLQEYIQQNSKAEDLDQAYLNLFEVAIKNDWFAENESVARDYLEKRPKGSVRSLAQIVATMARAQAGKFDEAVARFKELVGGLESNDQLDFATNFADNLASEAAMAGEFEQARRVFQVLTDKFPDEENLREHVEDVSLRYDLIGKPGPVDRVVDLAGKPLDLRELRGKYVLIDFWATWCAPCQADLPFLQEAYARHKTQGFEIISVSLDDTPEAVEDYVRQRKISWPQVHNPSATKDLVHEFAVGAIPANVLLSPDGRIIRLDLRGKNLTRTLESLLKSNVEGQLRTTP